MVSAEETETVLRFDWGSHADPPEVLANSELVFWVALARIGTQEEVRPLRVTIRRPPADTADFDKYLGCEIEAAPTQTIVFAASDAFRPFLTANEPVWKFFEPELRRRLGELDRDASTSDRVQAALVGNTEGTPTRVSESTRDHSVSLDPLLFRGFRGRRDPRSPARPALTPRW